VLGRTTNKEKSLKEIYLRFLLGVSRVWRSLGMLIGTSPKKVLTVLAA